ncbi:MAG: hypothetical protein IKV03_02425 [Alphaproteobacteria bacterium]|nr:hypothetical protein [Alphaproteobacteria bacterium]
MMFRSLLCAFLLVPILGVSPVRAADPVELEYSWGELDGVSHSRMISPSGDILDTGMDTLAPLGLAPLNIPGAGITPELFKDPEKAATTLKTVLFPPESDENVAKTKVGDKGKMLAYRKVVMDQTISYAMGLGKLVENGIENFNKRRDNALKFVNTAQNLREDVQVLNGIMLGQLGEANKTLGLNATFAIMQLSDVFYQSGATAVNTRKNEGQ